MQPILVGIIIVVLYLWSTINILKEYERGVIFRLGRLVPEACGPGLIFVFWPIFSRFLVTAVRGCPDGALTRRPRFDTTCTIRR